MTDEGKSLQELGVLLGDFKTELDCSPFLSKLFSCQGPRGFVLGMYQEGHWGASCERERINSTTCLKMKVCRTEEEKREYYDAGVRSLAKLAPQETTKHIWERRTVPDPQFHAYQTTSPEEKQAIINEIMSQAKSC